MTPALPSLLSRSLREALNDFRQRWKIGIACLGTLLWLYFLIGGISALADPNRSITGQSRTQLGSACRPDDSFSALPIAEPWSQWDGSGFFQITLGFGSLSFSAVKAIDVAWDIIVGRGGQAIIALISWQVIKRYVTTSMVSRGPVTFHTYRTVFLQDQPLVLAIPRLLKDFVSRHRLHSKAAMACILSTCCFILAFPTLASAMTGYTTNVKAYVPERTSSNLIAFENFRRVQFVIHDGDRIGRTEDYRVSWDEKTAADPVILYTDEVDYTCGEWMYANRNSDKHTFPSDGQAQKCYMQLWVYKYLEEFGFEETNVASQFAGVALSPPKLNITGYYLPSSSLKYQGYHMNGMWTHLNETYDLAYVTSKGSCQAVNSYRWGFSFLLLFITFCSLLVWTVAMLVMWLCSQAGLKRHGFDQVSGDIKAVFELAERMQEQLDLTVPTKSAYQQTTDAQLRRRIDKELQGGSISYSSQLILENSDDSKVKATVFTLLPRLTSLWMVAFLVAFVGSISMFEYHLIEFHTGLLHTMVLMLFSIYLLLAVAIGSTNGSRVVLFVCLGSLLTALWFAAVVVPFFIYNL